MRAGPSLLATAADCEVRHGVNTRASKYVVLVVNLGSQQIKFQNSFSIFDLRGFGFDTLRIEVTFDLDKILKF